MSIFVFFSCNRDNIIVDEYSDSLDRVKSLHDTSNVTKNWFKKDLNDDRIPGISLNKLYQTLLKNRSGSGCVIAVVDMAMDISHESLGNAIWVNKDEIPNNKIDDDRNGYIDDERGWNFIGNTKNENILFANYEYTRVIKKYQDKFRDKSKSDIPVNDLDKFNLFSRALEKYEKRKKYAFQEKKYIDELEQEFNQSIETIQLYDKSIQLNPNDLKVLRNKYPNDKKLIKAINFILKKKLTESWVKNYKLKTYERINKLLNLEYNERLILGENSSDLNDSIYGNNIVNGNLDLFDHGTKIAGCIASIVINENVNNSIEIMPIAISPFGDEHDKDIALAIRYAVNNGAKVINLSFGKEFSLNPEWVIDALKYAELNNVLVIKSAGNDNLDLDKSYNYPDDSMDRDKKEVHNFIRVGSTSYFLNEKFRSTFSNYGRSEVDIFAPGEKIFTSVSTEEKYSYVSGTSVATAITSSLAGLLYSYYPDLSVQQIKNIILESGVSYNLEVDISKKGDIFKKTKSFKELSSSGSLLNAYNAFIMAENYLEKK
ncbi:S8 family serine peptidase [Aquimarina sp. SS2-1]|uniref:S8 family serine peptidase n=1 Tax=Aquimarina besae TaxID=3342247 RepID=UPI00366B88A2